MILYVDASCLLKHYVLEEASGDVDAWIAHADFVATACTSLAEAAAELARRPPWIQPSRKVRGRALEKLTEDWADYIVIETDERRAAAIAWRRHVGGPEATHLAAALTIADMAAPVAVVFSSFDRELCRAAREEGLGVLQSLR
jgi:predicted nucleic acid-binding protein